MKHLTLFLIFFVFSACTTLNKVGPDGIEMIEMIESAKSGEFIYVLPVIEINWFFNPTLTIKKHLKIVNKYCDPNKPSTAVPLGTGPLIRTICIKK